MSSTFVPAGDSEAPTSGSSESSSASPSVRRSSSWKSSSGTISVSSADLSPEDVRPRFCSCPDDFSGTDLSGMCSSVAVCSGTSYSGAVCSEVCSAPAWSSEAGFPGICSSEAGSPGICSSEADCSLDCSSGTVCSRAPSFPDGFSDTVSSETVCSRSDPVRVLPSGTISSMNVLVPSERSSSATTIPGMTCWLIIRKANRPAANRLPFIPRFISRSPWFQFIFILKCTNLYRIHYTPNSPVSQYKRFLSYVLRRPLPTREAAFGGSPARTAPLPGRLAFAGSPARTAPCRGESCADSAPVGGSPARTAPLSGGLPGEGKRSE